MKKYPVSYDTWILAKVIVYCTNTLCQCFWHAFCRSDPGMDPDFNAAGYGHHVSSEELDDVVLSVRKDFD